MKTNNNILAITPIEHIKDLVKNLKKKSNLKIIEDPSKKQLIKIIANFNIIFTNPNKSKIYFNKEILTHAKNLKIICTASTGTTHIDKNELKKRNIKLISLTKEFNILKKISSTSELAITMTLLSIRRIKNADFDVIKKNNWNYEKFISNQFSSLRVGVIGYGRLGRIYANFAYNLGFKVYLYDPFVKQYNKTKFTKLKTIKELIYKSNIISLHIHADKKNYNFINKDKLKYFKNDAILINTSRGEIINDKDLISFLKVNKNAIYCTDVLTNETRGVKQNPIVKYAKRNNNILITPHIGGMTHQAQYLAYNHAAKLLNKYLK